MEAMITCKQIVKDFTEQLITIIYKKFGIKIFHHYEGDRSIFNSYRSAYLWKGLTPVSEMNARLFLYELEHNLDFFIWCKDKCEWCCKHNHGRMYSACYLNKVKSTSNIKEIDELKRDTLIKYKQYIEQWTTQSITRNSLSNYLGYDRTLDSYDSLESVIIFSDQHRKKDDWKIHPIYVENKYDPTVVGVLGYKGNLINKVKILISINNKYAEGSSFLIDKNDWRVFLPDRAIEKFRVVKGRWDFLRGEIYSPVFPTSYLEYSLSTSEQKLNIGRTLAGNDNLPKSSIEIVSSNVDKNLIPIDFDSIRPLSHYMIGGTTPGTKQYKSMQEEHRLKCENLFGLMGGGPDKPKRKRTIGPFNCRLVYNPSTGLMRWEEKDID